MIFSRHLATFPWASHALWFYSQMVRWGQCAPSQHNADAARAAYRPDLYRAALQQLRVELPMTDFKAEHSTASRDTGTQNAFAAEGFFDGRTFDPADLANYLASFPAPKHNR